MPDEGTVYAFARWEVDLIRRELRVEGVTVPVGGRAFEIMEVLVEARGKLVSKDELFARVWPGAVVEENTLQVHIYALRKALGQDRQMLKTSSGRGYCLTGAWTSRRKSEQEPVTSRLVPHAAPQTPTNLPFGNRDLIGRAEAIRELNDLISAYRVVTLVGPGGIGKTALALEVARSLSTNLDREVRLAELGSASDSTLVPSTVASALDLALGSGEVTSDALARAVGDRKLWLVLDNCEHVIDAAAETVEALLRHCPRTTVLATSRENLRIEGEHAYRVSPLNVPQQEDEQSAALESSAVQLLIARTKALDASFSPQASNLSLISAICRRLDGIPLAIEFAAARVATLGLQEVASRLDTRFELLTQNRRTALPRHQTLRATLDWSYELLVEAERRLLRHLSIFPGGFTIDAAAAVIDSADIFKVEDDLSNLVSKSLVSLDRSAAAGRWRLLETTRAYALEKLREAGEAEAAARRQAKFLCDLLYQATEGARPQPVIGDRERFAREIDNVRAALDWCFSPDGDMAVGIQLTAAYVPVWTARFLWLECRERAERALTNLDRGSSGLRLRLNMALALACVITLGSVERTKEVLAEALEIAEQTGDVDSILRTLTIQCTAYLNIGDTRALLETVSQYRKYSAGPVDRESLPTLQLFSGIALHHSGNYQEAQKKLEEVTLGYSRGALLQDHIGFTFDRHAFAGSMLARTLWLQGDLRKAYELAHSVLHEAQTVGRSIAIWWALRFAVIPLRLMSGDFVAAEEARAAVADLAVRQNARFWDMVARCFEGRLLIQRGEFETGTRHLREALKTSVQSGWAIWYPDFLGTLAEGLGALGRVSEAMGLVEEALIRAERLGERWSIAELLRIKGGLYFKQGGRASEEAMEKCFADGLAIAAEQNAEFWTLRLALSLARARVAQGQRDEAREVLAPIYRRFTDGFETADLRAGKQLLDWLSA